MVSNAERLAGLVEDMELLIFESVNSPLPSSAEICRLLELSQRGNFSYTVHLPIDIDVCSSDESFRLFSVRMAEKITALTAPLSPYGYVLHLPGGGKGGEQWTEAACKSLSRLCSTCGQVFFVENLTYPFTILEPVLRRSGVSLCLDIGHANGAGDDWRDIYRRFSDRTGIVHFYMNAPDSGRHLCLSKAPRGFVSNVTHELLSSGYEGILTIELFSERDFFISKSIVEREIAGWAAR